MKWLCIGLLCTSCMMPYDVAMGGLPEVNTLEEAWKITSEVVYDNEDDRFQSPAYTYRNMRGDCEDIAALFVALVIDLYPDARIVIYRSSEHLLHAIVYVDGVYLEPQGYGKTFRYVDEMYRWTLDFYLMRVTC